MSRHLSALVAASFVAGLAGVARADLPPPPGQHRVDYSFEIDADVEGSAIVAFPQYGSGDASNVAVVEPGKAVRPFKGWTPGLYLLPKADVAGIPKGDQEAAKTYLASKAKVCLKEVPRVFQIAEATNVDKLHDVIHLAAKGPACEASLVKSLYTAPDGKKAEGGVEASGQRRAPAPFDQGLPSVSEAGFTGMGVAQPSPSPPPSPSPGPAASPAGSTSSSPAPSGAPAPSAKPGAESGGCAGCTLTETSSRGGAAFVAGAALAIAIVRRRRAR
jgi:hypothetical protein